MSDINLLKPGDIEKYTKELQKNIYYAARDALKGVGIDVQNKARAQISAAGFTGKWVSGFRTYIFPKAINTNAPQELVMRGFHSYNIANVFERGARISGKPLLWVALPTAPAKVRGKATTAAGLIASGVRLHRIGGRNHPLLVGTVLLSAPNARRKSISVGPNRRITVAAGSVTLQQLLNGQSSRARRAARQAQGRRLGPNYRQVSIPLFIGYPSVEIRKRFNITPLYEQAQADAVERFQKNFVVG